MMLMNTKFFVSSELTRQEFLRLTNEWLHRSSYYDISLDDYNNIDDEYTVESEDGTKKIVIGNYAEALTLQIVNICPRILDDTDDDDDQVESSTYYTNYVLIDTDEKPMLHISQEKVFNELSLSRRRSVVRIPNLMKDVFWNEYGGMDNDLVTEDKPLFLRKSDMALAKQIVNQEIDFCNPIVYISPNSSTGYYDVNPNYLAQELMGQAHVVVESSPKIASDIKSATDGANPFNGAVRIYLPGKQSMTLLGDKGFNGKVINTVRELLSKVGVDDKYNITRLRQAHLFDKIKNGGHADEDFAAMCETVLNDKDCEVAQLKKEIAVLRQQLSSATAKADSLQGSFDSYKEENPGECIELKVTENDLYSNERKDVILKILQKEFIAMKDDANLSRSRKFDVISDVLEHNFPSKADAELIECIRGAFKDGALSGAGIGRLQAAGFVVEKCGRQAHYRINFGGDERYEASFSSTPSDKARGTKNLISDFTNVLFGF